MRVLWAEARAQRACNMASVQWRDGQPTCRWYTKTTRCVLEQFCCQQIRRRGALCVLGVVRAKTGVRGSRTMCRSFELGVEKHTESR